MDAVTAGMAGVVINMPRSQQQNMYDSDAWTLHPLEFSSELSSVTSVEQLNELLQGSENACSFASL